MSLFSSFIFRMLRKAYRNEGGTFDRLVGLLKLMRTRRSREETSAKGDKVSITLPEADAPPACKDDDPPEEFISALAVFDPGFTP